jgi:hypothetical protein
MWHSLVLSIGNIIKSSCWILIPCLLADVLNAAIDSRMTICLEFIRTALIVSVNEQTIPCERR